MPQYLFKQEASSEVKERPHSFSHSGGLSSADLRRLVQAGGPMILLTIFNSNNGWLPLMVQNTLLIRLLQTQSIGLTKHFRIIVRLVSR